MGYLIIIIKLFTCQCGPIIGIEANYCIFKSKHLGPRPLPHLAYLLDGVVCDQPLWPGMTASVDLFSQGSIPLNFRNIFEFPFDIIVGYNHSSSLG